NGELLREVVDRAGLAASLDKPALEKAADELKKKLKVSPVLKANMIRASYSAAKPQEVLDVLKALSDGYLDKHLLAHGSKGAYDLFNRQAMFYEQQLRDLQGQLSTFQERRDIVALGQQKDLNLRKLLDLQAAYSDNQAAQVANTRRIERLHQTLASLVPRITTQSRVVPNQYSVERLNTMLVELQNKRTELLTKYQTQERLVREVDAQIADTRAALERANGISSTEQTTDVNPVRQTLEGDLAKAELSDTEYRAHTASLEKEISNYRELLTSLQGATADDDQFLRNIKEAEDNFFLYSKKREEARIEEAMDRDRIANVTLVEPPRLPVLATPKVSFTVVGTYALGCVLIIGFGFVAGLARPYVYTSWELESITGPPVLASVPQQSEATASRALLTASIPEL
ncbi:MAG TPA: hypothetical protein VNY05_13925, partial [Candidatus Acidoferrales bacterium]|nr:hypothetical protein [Candidatus Acidoferrales bacterium]